MDDRSSQEPLLTLEQGPGGSGVVSVLSSGEMLQAIVGKNHVRVDVNGLGGARQST